MNLADEGQQRNLKDFLLLYNKLTEQCFERCVYNLNNVGMSKAENDCVGVCTDRYVTYNQKLMMKFMEHQNLRQQAAAREAEAAAAQQGTPSPGMTNTTPKP
ncbi:mitochondrial import inner membrane translocase subunit Tim9-like [Haliotis asinina]|uniref:mitochondrial import inner membrane translocase subunit Tim9-like n=1 Tax=Haliotis asinina TaxID=109174 RepID=UPI003531AB55